MEEQDNEPAEKAAPKKPKLRTWVSAALLRARNYYKDSETEKHYFQTKGPYNPFTLKSFKHTDDYYNTWALELEADNLITTPRVVEEVVRTSQVSTPVRVVTDQLDHLAAHYDGQDHLGALVATVRTEDIALFGQQFRKWLLNVVRQVYEPEYRNEYAFVLVGGQGVGKTSFAERLLYDEEYFVSPATAFNFKNKEHLLLLSTHILVLLDEMSAYSNKEALTDLKAAFSLIRIKADKKYKETGSYLRIGSFIGSVNKDDFLRDDTGDRRFLVHKFYSYDHAAYNAVNKMQLWGQLVSLYKSGEAEPFTEAEIASIMDRNLEKFTLYKREDQFIEDMLYITKNEEHRITARELNAMMAKYDQEVPKSGGYGLTSTSVLAKLALLGVEVSVQKKVAGKNTRVHLGVCLRSDMPTSSADTANVYAAVVFGKEMADLDPVAYKATLKGGPKVYDPEGWEQKGQSQQRAAHLADKAAKAEELAEQATAEAVRKTELAKYAAQYAEEAKQFATVRTAEEAAERAAEVGKAVPVPQVEESAASLLHGTSWVFDNSDIDNC